MEQKETFTYTYSAAQQEEIAAIRRKYVADTQPTLVDKMEQLRQLDAGVSRKASTIGLSVGILSAIIMGSGMSLVMTDLGSKIGIHSPFLPGVLIGIVGMVGVIAAYPVYQRVLRKEREKIAPQILKLTEELSKS